MLVAMRVLVDACGVGDGGGCSLMVESDYGGSDVAEREVKRE